MPHVSAHREEIKFLSNSFQQTVETFVRCPASIPKAYSLPMRNQAAPSTANPGPLPVSPVICGLILASCVLLFFCSLAAQAQTEYILFNTPYFEDPSSPVVMDVHGNLYGTTLSDFHNRGSIYKLTPPSGSGGQWSSTTLHVFPNGGDYQSPGGDLVIDSAGNIFGATGSPSGSGIVYEIDAAGEEKVIYTFKGGASDPSPESLIEDSSGNFYANAGGGTAGYGTLLKLSSDGTKQILYNFQGPSDGERPNSPLVLDSQGSLYGTTFYGGPNHAGTIFELAWDGTFTTLYAFGKSKTDALYPYAGLTIDNQGNLYGTSGYGGAYDYGTVFELTTSNTLRILYSFKGGHNDGQLPEASLILDTQGNLYGTTSDNPDASGPFGTVFEITPQGKEIILHEFTGSPDGFNPLTSLLLDSRGDLYGTTQGGGVARGGTVFKIAP
jgi:uncharacterized repeat protein (TIGR03803 family)